MAWKKRLFNFLSWTLIYSSNIWLVLHVQTCVVLITMKVARPPVSALDVGFLTLSFLSFSDGPSSSGLAGCIGCLFPRLEDREFSMLAYLRLGGTQKTPCS